MNAIAQTTSRSLQKPRHTLSAVLKFIGQLPKQVVMMGVAYDGLPILWNTRNAEAPNIVVWNRLARQGLQILKVVAEHIFSYIDPNQIEFVVFTKHPEDWGELNNHGFGTNSRTSCIGIIPFHSELSGVVISGLSRWVQERHDATKHPVVILVDGLENLLKSSEDFRNNFQHILDIGRNKNIYVMGTASKSNFSLVYTWLGGFQAEIYGTDIPDEFEIMEGKNLVIFYTPKTELI